jgi:hypothetical protein
LAAAPQVWFIENREPLHAHIRAHGNFSPFQLNRIPVFVQFLTIVRERRMEAFQFRPSGEHRKQLP